MAQSIETFNAQKLVDQLLAEKAKGIAEVFPGELASAQETLAIWQAVDVKLAAQPQPPATASQAAQDDAAKGPNETPVQVITPTGRITDAPTDTPPTNADKSNTTDNGAGDSGTNDDVRPLELTQSLSSAPLGIRDASGRRNALFDARSLTPALDASGRRNAAYDERVGASQTDDSSSTTTTQTATNNLDNNNQIIPQPNVLDKFNSYTYNASVYLMTPADYNKLLVTKKKQINGYRLLFQTGGAPANVGGVQGFKLSDTDAGRNPAFPQDFYIDSITVENNLPGKVVGAMHSVTSVKITVIEPGGITLLDRMYEAVQDHAPKAAGVINYTSAVYLLVIRFYGYDETGKLVGGAKGLSDSNSVVEKFIPFIINNINWSVGNKLVSYEITGSPVGQSVAATTRRGTIPYDVELSDKTVGGLLGSDVEYKPDLDARVGFAVGDAIDRGEVAPPKANAATSKKKTITQGLTGAMNDYQQVLVQRDTYKVADQYYIRYAKGAEKIRDATIVLPGRRKNKAASPMCRPSALDPTSLLQAKVSANFDIRNFSLTAGQQIVQAIELTIRNSSYIQDQALIVINEETNLAEPNPDKPTKPMEWFKITMEAEQLDHDVLRNDHAYKVIFVISAFKVPDFSSKYFPATKFPGVHKSYPYWFTGQNTAVLDYTANFNTQYTITVSGDSPKNSVASAIKSSTTASMRDIPRYNYQPKSSESGSGAKNSGNEVAANAAEYLYDPSSLGEVKMRIVGDPAWLQQGSLFAGVSIEEFDYNPFLPDGSINFDSSQVLFEVSWQRPEDYNLSTGLADPYSRTEKTTGNRLPIQSYVYVATTCVNEFKQGKFEQVLNGALFMFPIPKKNTTDTSINDAENRRLERVPVPADYAKAQEKGPLSAPDRNFNTGDSDNATTVTNGSTAPDLAGPPGLPNSSGQPINAVPATVKPPPPKINGIVSKEIASMITGRFDQKFVTTPSSTTNPANQSIAKDQ